MLCGLVVALSTWWLFPGYRDHHINLEDLQVTNLQVPMVLWGTIYAMWNLYHAGAQNFGFLCLYRRKGYSPFGRKFIVLMICVVVTVAIAHEAPRFWHYRMVFLFCLGCVTVNHWLAAIGLSSHAYARHKQCSPWLFVVAVTLAGTLIGYAIFTAVMYSPRLAILALSLRGALGIWHFLQDRWVWKLSDPQVRATIGRDLLKHRETARCEQMAPTGAL